MSHKINLTFDILTIQRPAVSNIIKKCIQATLDAEGVTAYCEINVLVTNDKGIHAINLASRQIDRPTDVLSFPMFQLEHGEAEDIGGTVDLAAGQIDGVDALVVGDQHVDLAVGGNAFGIQSGLNALLDDIADGRTLDGQNVECQIDLMAHISSSSGNDGFFRRNGAS